MLMVSVIYFTVETDVVYWCIVGIIDSNNNTGLGGSWRSYQMQKYSMVQLKAVMEFAVLILQGLRQDGGRLSTLFSSCCGFLTIQQWMPVL
jgi:hypothetical protein